MTDQTPRASVDPFPADDPLAYAELGQERTVLRALMAVLATTGTVVTFPAAWCPGVVELEIAAGWRLRPTLQPVHGTGFNIELSCVWVPPPPPERPA